MTYSEEIYDEPAYSKNVLELIRVAHEYCLYCESIENQDIEDTLIFFHRLGPLLYLKGSLLPELEVEDTEFNERFVTQEEWENVFNMFRAKLLPDDEFYHVDYEFSDESETVKASLSENFTDLYQDLKDFLLLYQKNSRHAKQNAVHECKNLFATHWGPKTLSSLRYIHYLLNKNRFTQEFDDLY